MKEYEPLIIAIIIVLATLYTGYKDGDIFVPINNIDRTKISSSEKSAQSSSVVAKTSPAQNKNTGQVKGAYTSNTPNSPYKNNIGINAIKNPATVAGAEYITISSSGIKEPVLMMGWKITSDVSGNTVVIGSASALPEILPTSPLYLSSGQKIILVSGHSPINISFQTNLCTGYFEDEKNFTPDLPLQCPAGKNEKIIPEKVENSETCMDFMNSLSTCEPLPKNLPNLPASCKKYITETISYEGCVALHKNNSRFYKQEWRVFIGSSFPLWQEEKDTLRLWDTKGRLVDIYEYDFD